MISFLTKALIIPELESPTFLGSWTHLQTRETVGGGHPQQPIISPNLFDWLQGEGRGR